MRIASESACFVARFRTMEVNAVEARRESWSTRKHDDTSLTMAPGEFLPDWPLRLENRADFSGEEPKDVCFPNMGQLLWLDRCSNAVHSKGLTVGVETDLL